MQGKNPVKKDNIPINAIAPSKWRRNKGCHDEAVRELATSIRRHRLRRPIVVRELPGGGYEIIDGHARFDAVKANGDTEICARVCKGISDADAWLLSQADHQMLSDALANL